MSRFERGLNEAERLRSFRRRAALGRHRDQVRAHHDRRVTGLDLPATFLPERRSRRPPWVVGGELAIADRDIGSYLFHVRDRGDCRQRAAGEHQITNSGSEWPGSAASAISRSTVIKLRTPTKAVGPKGLGSEPGATYRPVLASTHLTSIP
jgi:hypothetical protein